MVINGITYEDAKGIITEAPWLAAPVHVLEFINQVFPWATAITYLIARFIYEALALTLYGGAATIIRFINP